MSAVIIEGPDGAGKTTLIEALRQRWRWSGVDHHGAYLGEERIARHYLKSLYRGLAQPQRVQLLDRSWLAEPIYGAVMRGGADRITIADRRMLERVALGAGAVTVLCLPPFKACERAWKGRLEREYPQRADQLRALYDAYKQLGADLVYDYTTDTAAELTKALQALLVARVNQGPGLGSPKATTLLVGDEVSQHGHPALPFVDLTRGGCSAWLAEHLEEHGVAEAGLYWINQATSEPDDFAAGLGQFERVVALGGQAIAWCETRGVAHVATYHPQYWKRFRHHEEYPLGGLLA